MLMRRDHDRSPAGLESFAITHLLLPALQLLDKVVVALRNLVELRVHATLEVDKVLPGLERVTRVLIPLADNLR